MPIGVAQLQNETSQMNLLATPSVIDDDAVSDWSTGAGGKNAQKLSVDVSPDYTGMVRCRVVVATGATSAVYVDTRPVVT